MLTQLYHGTKRRSLFLQISIYIFNMYCEWIFVIHIFHFEVYSNYSLSSKLLILVRLHSYIVLCAASHIKTSLNTRYSWMWHTVIPQTTCKYVSECLSLTRNAITSTYPQYHSSNSPQVGIYQRKNCSMRKYWINNKYAKTNRWTLDVPAPTSMPLPPHTLACCDLDLWPPESNQVISRG